MSSTPSRNLLRTLKEEGIEEIWQPPQTPAASAPSFDAENSAGLKTEMIQLRDKVLPCTRCSELAYTRTHVVFGAGNIRAKLMFVGEAPGAEEDRQGLPFVGAAGQLLTKIIESIGLKREEVFIANVLKCRPPGNRPPKPDEIQNCEPYLRRQLELISPKIICALGTFAAQTLLKSATSISRSRGQFYPMGNSKLICTYHPAYLLRNPADKRLVWEDMKRIKKELEQ